ncbi:MAG: hypothetical protein E7458_05620 [Ruminococcaceae bacterium]|nr:hypothetical protein [Oscillospiraceae bacterium]
MGGSIVMSLVCFLCGGVFLAIGQWARRRKEPMHFYSGTEVAPEEIRDIPAYNRANARLWSVYSLPYFLSAVIGIRYPGFAGILVGLSCMPGIFFLLFSYHRIYRKYATKP